jgi:hypothetical protein
MTATMSTRIRSHFRDWAATSTLGEIARMWQSEGFAPSGAGIQEQGARRTEWRDYEESVDWANPDHVTRAIRVLESLIIHDDAEAVAKHSAVLGLDGWRLDDRRRLVHESPRFSDLVGLARLRDPSGILQSFEQAKLLLDSNPAGCIGAAKDLIEATAKTVLEGVGAGWTESDDFADLVARVQKELALHPSAVDGSLPTAEATKRILGGLSAIAIGVNMLRNKVGAGHGRSTAANLTVRHARLALGTAWTWSELVLETYSDPTAPWQTNTGK